MKNRCSNTLHLLAASLALLPLAAQASLKLAEVPMDVLLNQANSMMVIDDSGSMDFEISLDGASDGVPWWSNSKNTYVWDASANHKAPYLFPNGCTLKSGSSTECQGDARFLNNYNSSNKNINHIAVPPLEQYMWLRSPDYNSIYYDPRKTYRPWPDANIGGVDVSFSDMQPEKARSHPWFKLSANDASGSALTTMDLTATYYGKSTSAVACNQLGDNHTDWTFIVFPGETLPASIEGRTLCKRTPGSGSWSAVSSGQVTGNSAIEVMIPYRPATFWLRDSSCTAAFPACAAARDGSRIRRYDINNFTGSSWTLPDGTVIARSKAQELQNFANWFSYYRKRKLLMAAGMGATLDSLQKNHRQLSAAPMPMRKNPTVSSSNPVMHDFTSTDSTRNGRALLGEIYGMEVFGGTPTFAALGRAGNAFGYSGPMTSYLINRSSTDEITDQTSAEKALRCSANSAFVLTDGYATDVSNQSKLFNVAKQYYDGLRWWGPAGGGNGNVGRTMNTYGITLGMFGDSYKGDPDAAPPDSVNPSSGQPSAIDDLWLATRYSKGRLLSASDATGLEASFNRIVSDMFASGSGTGLSYSDVSVSTGDNTVVQTAYNSGDWTGEIAAYSVHLSGSRAGFINYDDRKWSAKTLLDANPARVIATRAGGKGIPFTASALAEAGALATFNTGATADGKDVVSWLRGDRSLEGTRYRARSHLLGDIVHATPAYVSRAFAQYTYAGYQSFAARVKSARKPMVYVGANDGMLHALDATSGEELWAYVPGLVHERLNALAQPGYQHRFTVDGSLTAWDVEFSANGNTSSDSASRWRTLLVGGLRAGGSGYYALDVTEPELAGGSVAEREQALAGKVLWEFNDPNMGHSYGKPVIARTERYGWVVLLSSGYNTPDGRGHLYVVKAEDGSLIKDIVINAPAAGAAFSQVGLAQVTGVVNYKASPWTRENANLLYAYGGDLNGNLWRFDLSSADKADWSVSLLAENLNPGGALGKAPIMAAPDVALIPTPAPEGGFPTYQDARDLQTSRLMVFVGNGLLLHADDFALDDRSNGFHAIWDAWADTGDADDRDLVIGRSGGACNGLSCMARVGLGQGASSLGLNNWGTTENSTQLAWWVVNQKSFWLNGKQRVARGWYFSFSETGGERMINPPVVYNGKVIFTTTMASDSRHSSAGSCERAFSALYNLNADKGGSEAGLPSRINLGFGIASAPSIIMTPDGARVTVSQKEGALSGLGTSLDTECRDGAGCNTSTEAGGAQVVANTRLRRFGWREIFR